MRLGMMLNDGEEPSTGGTFDNYQKTGGVQLPYIKPLYLRRVDTFILRRDPATGETYENDTPEPTPAPIVEPPVVIVPSVIADPGISTKQPDIADAVSKPPAQSLMKPLLIAGAVVAALTLLKD